MLTLTSAFESVSFFWLAPLPVPRPGLDETQAAPQLADMDAGDPGVRNPDDFEHVAVPHLDAVARFARSLTRDRDDADDLVQETFLRAYRGWHTFERGSNPRPWLFAICRNTFLRLRQKAGELVESEEGDVDAMPAVMEHVAVVRAGLGDMFERLELGDAIRRAVDQLPEPHHSVLVLVDLEERSYAEAAEVLMIPVGTVRSRLFRARRMVQQALIVYAEDMGFGAQRAGGGSRVLESVPRGVSSSAVGEPVSNTESEVHRHA